jgi:hypothetical protein
MKAARVLFICVTALLLAANLAASPDRGTIQGTVTDPQGAVIPGAQVLVKNMDTGVEWNLTTNSAGFYLVAELVPGKYMVRLKFSGFSTLEISNVMVTAGGITTANADMKVGEPTQSINVTAELPLVERGDSAPRPGPSDGPATPAGRHSVRWPFRRGFRLRQSVRRLP